MPLLLWRNCRLPSRCPIEIVGDTLYFCGSDGNANYVGLFNIQSTFFGLGQVSLIQILFSPAETVNNITYTGQFRLSKLEVQARGFANPADLHIYMIGNVDFGVPDIVTDYSCILDVRYNGTTWVIDMTTEPDRIYHFNDLTVTDNYLWVVGNKHRVTGEYMHGYCLPTSGSMTILNRTLPTCTSSTFTMMDYWSTPDYSYYPISRQLVETLPNDVVAVACYGMINTYTPAVVVSLYSVGTWVNLIKRMYVPNVTATDEFRDLKYNPMSDRLFLMPDHLHSVVKDSFYCFDISSNSAFLHGAHIKEVHSVDIRQNDIGAVVSCMTLNTYLGEWRMFPTEDECAGMTELPVDLDNRLPWHDRNLLDINPVEYIQFEEQPIIHKINHKVLCGELMKQTDSSSNQ